MQYITDPDLIRELESEGPVSGASSSSYAGAQPPEEEESGSILGTAAKHLSTLGEAYLASAVSPEYSNYSNARLRKAQESLKAEQAKLGLAGNIAAGLTAAVPAIAAGMVNPWLGGAAAMGMSTGDILNRQFEETGEFDQGKAVLGGLATGGIDVATGRAANLARSAMGAGAGALPVTAPLAQRVGINLTEDVTSNVGGEIVANLASGQEWNKDLAEAAVVGGIGSGVVRGSLAGMNKALNTPLNQWGKDAINDVQNIKTQTGLNPDRAFVDEVFEYENGAADFINQMDNAQTPEDFEKALRSYETLSGKNSGSAGAAQAIKIAQDQGLGFIDSAFNVNLRDGFDTSKPSFNLGEKLGLDKAYMDEVGTISMSAQESRFGKGKEKGEITESFFEDFQKKGKDVLGNMKGSYFNNITHLDRLIETAKRNPDSTADEIRMLTDLRTDLDSLNTYMKAYTSKENLDVGQSILTQGRRAMENASKLGIHGDLVGVDGKKGNWDPIGGIKTIEAMEDMVHQQMKNFTQGTPNSHKSKFLGASTAGNLTDFALATSGMLPAAIARRSLSAGLGEAKARYSQRKLRKAKETGTQRIGSITATLAGGPKSRAQEGLDAGDLGMAAKGAEADLQDQGLTPPVAEPVKPEPIVEAPTTPVAPSTPTSKPLIVSTPKAPEGPVQAAPEPAPAPTPEKMARKPRTLKKAPELEESLAAKVEDATPITDKVEVQDVTPKKTLTPDRIQRVEKKEKKEEAPKKLQPAKIPRTVKKAPELEDSLASQTDAAPVTEKFEIQDVTPKKPVDAKDSMAPKIKKDEVKVEVEPEEPKPVRERLKILRKKREEAKKVEEEEKKDSDALIMSKKLKKEEAPEVEETKVEEPEIEEATPEVEPEAPKPRVSSSDLVLNPLKEKAKTLMNRKERAANPEAYREILRAQEDLKLITGLSNKIADTTNTSPEEVFAFIHEAGGVAGLRKAAAEAGYKPTEADLKAFLTSRIREFSKLRKEATGEQLQALRNTAKTVTEGGSLPKSADESQKAASDARSKARDEAERRRIAKAHGVVRSRLKSLGFSEDVQARALKEAGADKEGVDFDMTSVLNVARRLNREEVKDAEKKAKDALTDAKNAADEAAEVAEVVETHDQKWKAKELLKGLNVEDDINLQEIANKYLGKNRDKDPTDAELQRMVNEMDRYLEDEVTAYKGYLKSGSVDFTTRVAGLSAEKNRKTLQDNGVRLKDEVFADAKVKTEASEKARKAAQEAQAKKAEAEALKKAAAEREAKVEETQKLEDQMNLIRNALRDLEAPENVIEDIIWKTFVHLDKPLTPKEMNAAHVRAVRSIPKAVEKTSKPAEAVVRDELSSRTTDEVVSMGAAIRENASTDLTKPEDIAVANAVTRELRARGQPREADKIAAIQRAFTVGSQIQALFPDAKDVSMWIPNEAKTDIQKAYSFTEGSSAMGNLQKQLQNRFYQTTAVNFIEDSALSIGRKMLDRGIPKADVEGILGDWLPPNWETKRVYNFKGYDGVVVKENAPAQQATEAPVTEAHERVEAIAEKVKAETPVVHQVAPEGVPDVAPTVSVSGDGVSISTPTQKGVLDQDIKVSEKKETGILNDTFNENLHDKRSLREITDEEREKYFSWGKKRRIDEDSLNRVLEENQDIPFVEFKKKVQDFSTWKETEEQAVARAKKEGFDEEDIAFGRHTRLLDMSEKEFEGLKQSLRDRGIMPGFLVALRERRPGLSRKQAMEQTEAQHLEELNLLSTKTLKSHHKNFTAGALSKAQRDAVMRDLEFFSGDRLDKKFKDVLYNTKLQRGEGAYNKTAYSLWGDFLTERERKIALFAAYANRTTK